MHVRTGKDFFWQATIEGRDPWILNADHVQSVVTAHMLRLGRLSEDTKYEKRWPKRQRANIAQYRQQIAETTLSLQGARKQFAQAAATALRQTDDELGTALPKLEAARAQLQRGTLRAQSDGVVAGLAVFSAGSVVAPGEKLMEIVPSSPKLVVEARLSPNDLRGVRAGQTAEVRLTAFGSRGDPILHGNLTELSADSLTDERSGQRYYAATVTVPKPELAKLDGGDDDALRPGQPAQVMLPLKQRSALDYLFEPLSQSLWSAFRQR